MKENFYNEKTLLLLSAICENWKWEKRFSRVEGRKLRKSRERCCLWVCVVRHHLERERQNKKKLSFCWLHRAERHFPCKSFGFGFYKCFRTYWKIDFLAKPKQLKPYGKGKNFFQIQSLFALKFLENLSFYSLQMFFMCFFCTQKN